MSLRNFLRDIWYGPGYHDEFESLRGTVAKLQRKLARSSDWNRRLQRGLRKMKEQSALDHAFAVRLKAEIVTLKSVMESADKSGFLVHGMPLNSSLHRRPVGGPLGFEWHLDRPGGSSTSGKTPADVILMAQHNGESVPPQAPKAATDV